MPSDSEQRFKNLADHAPVMIWVSGPDKLCTFFNKSWLEFTGRTMEQELGDGWADGVHADDLKRCLETFRASFDARREFQMEYRLRRADGEYRWVLDNGVPYFQDGDSFAGYIGSCTDIAEIKAAQEATFGRQKIESLGLLARGVAHDFNNMQSAIVMMAELMLEQPSLDPAIAKEIGEIRDIAMRGCELTHELTVFSGEDIADVEPVSVAAVAEEIHNLLEVSIGKRATLKINLEKNLPPIRANSDHIRRILINLTLNAAEAIEDGSRGVIEIRMSRIILGSLDNAPAPADSVRDHVRIVVSDNGRGIPKELWHKILDPFFTTKAGSRGLGLAIVHSIVRRYNGVLSVHSVPDQGTRFEILLPCAAQAASKSIAHV